MLLDEYKARVDIKEQFHAGARVAVLLREMSFVLAESEAVVVTRALRSCLTYC